MLAITPGLAAAGGFFAQEQSVRGLGRAYSGEVADTGVDSLWWNPASIARGGGEAYVAAHGRWHDVTLRDEGSTVTRPIPPAGLTTPVGGESVVDNAAQDEVLANAAVAFPVTDRLAVGVSVTQPYQLDNRFTPTYWGRYDTLNARVDTTDIQATAAWQVSDWLDVGVGFSAQYTEALLETAMPNLSPLLPDAKSSVSGDGWNYGWSAGLQAHRGPVSLGASFRSAIEQELDTRVTVSGLLPPLDAANFTTPGTATFSTPWIAVVGARYRATPQLTLNGQIQRFGWSEYDAIRVRFPGGSDTVRQDFDDTTSAAVGADYAVSPRWTVRGGFQFNQTPTPSYLREPGIPDSDRKLYTVGSSLQLRPNVTVDAAVGYSRMNGARIYEDSIVYGGTPAATMTNVRGRASGHSTLASVGLRWKF